MKEFNGLVVLCALALFAVVACPSTLTAQTTPPTTSQALDPAITPLSVRGAVSELKTDTRQVVVTTEAGNQVLVTLSDRTEFMRIPPGEKTKDKFVKITSSDFGVGDSVFARGRMSADQKNLPALEFYVMSKGDIAEKRERENSDWRTRGIRGTISSLNPETKEITIDTRTPEGPKPVVLGSNGDTKFRRYAPDSIRFSDAKSSSFAELKVGDQLRALGTKSADGARFSTEEVVTGSFQTVSGSVTEVDAQGQQIKINDPQSKQTVTVLVRKDSSLRKLTPEMLAALMSKPDAGAKTAATKGTGDLQEMFDQLPTFTLQDLKPGDQILISSTKGSEPSRVTAIAVVSGVAPLLQNNQGARAVSLGAMSLGGP